MTLITLFNDLPDLALIEIFSYLSSLDILWAFSSLNQRISLLLVERGYFRCINLSSTRHRQFHILLGMLPLNDIKTLIIDMDSSPLQLSQWPYLPCLKTLILNGTREFNDVLIFVLLHAATLTHLTIQTAKESVATGFTRKYLYPLGRITLLVQNILLRHLPALRSLDLGTNNYNRMLFWRITSISVPLTYIRIVLNTVNDLLHLMSTFPLSKTLQQLHVKLSDCYWDFEFPLPTPNVLPRMNQLHTFTFAKSFQWKLNAEWTFVEILTSANVMPILRKANLAVVLTVEDLDRINQSSIFIDSHRVDVHFALHIHGTCHYTKARDHLPRGSLFHPKQVMLSRFITNYWHNIAHYTSLDFDYMKEGQACRHLWYTLPWSFDEFFQLYLSDRRITEREICVYPSSIDTIRSSSFIPLNGRGDTLLSPNFSLVRTLPLDNVDLYSFRFSEATMRVTIPTHCIILINNICCLNNCLFTLNIRSIHISLYSSSNIADINWNSLHVLSLLPLLKSLRVVVYNEKKILDSKDCQIIVKILSMLNNFAFCFRTNNDYCRDTAIDIYDVYGKSIVNLRHHIFTLLLDQQFNIIIESDGCGLTVWL
ncbi:unnamed protein product [Rotaria magnacalcarata]|uniref:F-box domain-containing protein n=2 Tax=Rotaria TaxID=231623 RepID=A0A815Z224_9BILA|nr:unnamed protein product [Rotaria magnacalcarata]CAF1577931.1 unnamed protein product [Rotaria magnacalcarata]CAF2109517.1 unnamed protein product [Rotaria magnacalcarata]CAF3904354.1 unnamed protein product [Rotaria magnacalcarata]CAF3940658.1 unnamed protein product [Rotaria magnacalcarata]